MIRVVIAALLVLLVPVLLPGQAASGDKAVVPIANAQISASAAIATSKLANSSRDFAKSFVLEAPVTGDSGKLQFELPFGATLQEISCNVAAATSATIDLFERARATPETGTTGMLTSALVCTTTGATTTSFADSGIAADVPIALGITAVSGTPAWLRVHVQYRMND